MLDEDKDFHNPRLLYVNKTRGNVWKWLLLCLCVAAFFLILAPGRPLQCLNVLFGLEAVSVQGR